jgi:hypothetical protein
LPFEGVDWTNNRRLLGPIGHIPPAEAEARHFGKLDGRRDAAQNASRPASGRAGAVQWLGRPDFRPCDLPPHLPCDQPDGPAGMEIEDA